MGEKVEEASAAELLFAEDFQLFTDDIPLRPVGPAVWRVFKF